MSSSRWPGGRELMGVTNASCAKPTGVAPEAPKAQTDRMVVDEPDPHQDRERDRERRDAVHGRPIYVDTTVTCAHSGYLPCQRARANKDGLAASNAVDDKRARYPPAGGELVPLAFEAGGRPADTTLAFVRGWGAACEESERSEVVRYAWQQFSLLLQAGNADLILSAVG